MNIAETAKQLVMLVDAKSAEVTRLRQQRLEAVKLLHKLTSSLSSSPSVQEPVLVEIKAWLDKVIEEERNVK